MNSAWDDPEQRRAYIMSRLSESAIQIAFDYIVEAENWD